MAFALEEHGSVVEGGRSGWHRSSSGWKKPVNWDETLRVVISGGNVDLTLLQQVARGHTPFGE